MLLNQKTSKEIIEKLKAFALIQIRKKCSRNRIEVNELVITERGITANYGCGAHHVEDPGSVELVWDEVEMLIPTPAIAQ